MYFVSKYISKEIDIVVIYFGEGFDEFCQGYIYFYKALSLEEVDEEFRRFFKDFYLYDVFRGDCLIVVYGLEICVFFLDVYFILYFLLFDLEIC